MTHVCVICGAEFKKHAPKQVTCGGECQAERQRQHVRNYNKRRKEMSAEEIAQHDEARSVWGQSGRKKGPAGQWFKCPNAECLRTNLIPLNMESIECWRCHTTVGRTEIIHKKRQRENGPIRSLDT